MKAFKKQLNRKQDTSEMQYLYKKHQILVFPLSIPVPLMMMMMFT
jgi:hypothetical protein